MGNIAHHAKHKSIGGSDSALQKNKSLNDKSNAPTLKKIARAATVPITSANADFIDEKQQYYEDDCVEETLINSETDNRKAIWDSPNKDDGIINCIGSLEMEYTKDLPQTEKSIGTGTVIHIDPKNTCYILTASHNFYQALRKCLNCNKQTIKAKCSHCTSRQKTKEIKPLQLTKADTIIFKRRCTVKEKIDPITGNKYTFGDPIAAIQIDPNNCYCREIFYRLYKHPRAGYDIGIMTFQCPVEDVELYRSVCSDITLSSESDFCGNKVQLFIYGYPADHKVNNQYQMYGMSTSMNGNEFEIKTDSASNMYYIKNTEIDTTAGQSGACVWSYDPKEKNKYRIHAIHTSGRPDKRNTVTQYDGENYGTFLDDSHVNWIKELMTTDGATKIKLMEQRQQVEEKSLIRYFQQQQQEILRLNNKLSNMETRDEWDATSIRNRQINIRNNIITLVGVNANDCVDTIFLKKIITEGEYKWKFKILKHTEGKPIYFGIWKADRGLRIPHRGYCNGYIGEKSGDSYVFDGGNATRNDINKDGKWKKKNSYGKKLKKGHIVEMCIDFTSNPHSLSFTIDNETFDDIPITDDKGGYRAAVSLFEKGDSVELFFE